MTKNASEHDDKHQCIQCGKTGNLEDFPNANFVETTIELTKEIAQALKKEPDAEIGLRKMMQTGIKMQELRKNCHDAEYIKSLIKNKEFPFENGDIAFGMMIVKSVMLPQGKLDEILDKD